MASWFAAFFREHCALFFDLLRDGGIGSGGDGLNILRIVEDSHFVHGAQDAVHHVVEPRLRDLTVGDGCCRGPRNIAGWAAPDRVR